MATSRYSNDLRKKVIKYLESGKSQLSTSETFDLNPSTISRWWIRYKKEVQYNPRRRIGKRPGTGLSEVKAYIESKPNFKSSEMGKQFGMRAGGAL